MSEYQISCCVLHDSSNMLTCRAFICPRNSFMCIAYVIIQTIDAHLNVIILTFILFISYTFLFPKWIKIFFSSVSKAWEYFEPSKAFRKKSDTSKIFNNCWVMGYLSVGWGHCWNNKLLVGMISYCFRVLNSKAPYILSNRTNIVTVDNSQCRLGNQLYQFL